MSTESYSALLSTANRALNQRKLTLSDSGEYTVAVSVDGNLKNDRYMITAKPDGTDIVAANDCAVHAEFGRLIPESKFDGRGDFSSRRNTKDP